MTSTEIHAPCGRLAGTIDRGIARYLGIPFAAEPWGHRRFRAPEPAASWDGVRQATTAGPGSLQPTLDPNGKIDAYYNPRVQGHDCLNLNVWTPDPGGSGLPVMVWIHGGGYISGGGAVPAHDGWTWARDGVVYVSINYRLSVEGFLYLGEGTANLGLLDAIAALRWVQDNIAAFGGDPGNVTIFGQSGGAVSVVNLLAMPSAAGLFRRAISQSGSTEGTASIELAERITARFAEIVHRKPIAEDLATVPDAEMLAAVVAIVLEYQIPSMWGAESFMISPFRSVVDGDTLPDRIPTCVERGASATVDLMAGATRDECTFLMLPLGMLETVDEAWQKMALDAFGLSRERLERYEEIRPGADEAELMAAAWTDWAFRIPTLRLVEEHSRQGGRSYTYDFTWPSPVPRVGAAHALECPFVNDSLDVAKEALTEPADLLGRTPPQALADRMHKAWIDFAATGDPGWAPFDTDKRVTMRFDVDSGPVDDLVGAERAIWDGIR